MASQPTLNKGVFTLTIISLIASFFVFVPADTVQAAEPTLDSAGSYGGSGPDYYYVEPYANDVDDDGNLYTGGYFEGVIDFDPGAGVSTLTAAAGDLYLQKLNPSGGLEWAVQFAGDDYNWLYDVATDAAGNVYAIGYFAGITDFDPGAGTFNLTSTGAQSDSFIVKLDSAGNFLWAQKSGSSNREELYTIATDSNNNVYVGGVFRTSIDADFGAGTTTFTASGTLDDGFIMKMDSAGNFEWARQYGSSNGTSDNLYGVNVDEDDNVYAVGNFGGIIDFDASSGTFNMTGSSSDGFYVKLDSSGDLVWAKGIFSDAGVSPFNFDFDAAGYAYVHGAFSGTADFDPSPSTYNLTSSSGKYFQKFDTQGNFLWAVSVGDSTAPNLANGEVDSDGNAYMFGRITAIRDLDPGAGTVNVDPANGRGYLLKLNGDGEFEWVQQYAVGVAGFVFGSDISIDSDDNIWLTGGFDGSGDFDPGAGVETLTSLDENGNGDSFVLKLAAEPVTVSWTYTEDFLTNAVVGPDLVFGTADDHTAGDATTINNARGYGHEASLRALEFISAKAGDYYTNAGIKADGTLWVAGDSFNGGGDQVDQLCQDSAYSYLPELTQIGTGTDWVYFSAGFDTLHMIKSDGTLWGCGEAQGGQLGDGTTAPKDVPTQIGSATDWATVSGGDWHTIGTKTDGSLWAWGADWEGSLGQGTYYEQVNSPIRIGSGNDWAQAEAGDTHNLAIKNDGTLWSWGSSYSGELGHGNEDSLYVPTQVLLNGAGADDDWAFVAAGFMMSAAIKEDGTLWFWGEGYATGLGHENPINVPTQVNNDTDWEEVSVGFYHILAKKTDGTIWGWGTNTSGELGLGTTSLVELLPVQIGTDTDWATITAAEEWSMAVKNDGSMWTAGANFDGQLAHGLPLVDAHVFTEVYDPPYYTSGSASGYKVYAGAGNTADWTGLSWNTESLPAGTEVRFRVRTSNDNVTYSAWSSYFTQDVDGSTSGTADLTSITDAAYLDIEFSFTTADVTITPTLLDFTLDYDPTGGVGGGATAPTVTTAAASGVGETSATLNGEITDVGSQAPTERGFEYGLTNAYGTTVSDTGSFGTGTFTEDLTGLTCNTTYHFRAFATSPDGTGDGSDQTFTTTACPAAPGNNTSSGSTSNPFEPIITPILPVIPLPAPGVEEPSQTQPAPTANPDAAEDQDESPQVDTPVDEQLEPVEEPEELPAVPSPTTNNDSRSIGGTRLSDRVSGWFGSAASLVPMGTMSSTGLVVLTALMPLAVSTATLAASITGIPLGLSGLQLLYSRYFQNLLSFLGLRKKRRVWGTVYDSQTKQPLDPAVVELIDAETGEVKERAITDLAGRFGFLATTGTFLLRASKTHYAFPSQKETGSTDEIFENLYHGEKITLNESSLVAPNIPMDPVGFDWNQEAKQKLLPSRLRLHYIVQLVFNTVFVIGFGFAIYNMANYGGLWNAIALGLYVGIFLIRLLVGRKHLWGRITRNGQPLANARLELSHPQFNVVMGKALSSVDGKFFIKTPEPGPYKLTVKAQDGTELLSARSVEVGKDSVLNSEINL